MFKRIVSCLLLVLMLIPVISPVFATTANNISQVNRNEAPSVESILNEYHEKVFAAQADANANARSGAEVQTDAIKQDTLNQLREAGYLAYDVNPDTFDSVAEELRTDLRQMDLDPNSSYIIVISGEEEPQENTASPAYIPPEIEDDTDGFDYTYNGAVYRLRYMIVTSKHDESLGLYESVNLNNNTSEDVLNTLINLYLDSITPVPIGTIASLLGVSYAGATPSHNGSLTFHAAAAWTRRYINVWSDYDQMWVRGARVEYAEVSSYCSGHIRNPSTGKPQKYGGVEKIDMVYSDYYHDYERQKIEAVHGYLQPSVLKYYTTGTLEFKHEGRTLITLSIGIL